ncbi:DNA photolyase phr1 [Diatrype stigma]|uniref:DNA photolyase phr1 n=1 Tax=Diatrype stigma TaxID=117547 RepID=A0AAN9UZ21_9PEZI
MPPKRYIHKSSAAPNGDGLTAEKKIKKARAETARPKDDPIRLPHPSSAEAEEHGIVLREFYPPEMSNARALAYNNDELPRPIEELNAALEETAEARQRIIDQTSTDAAVVHWFRWDLRTTDNRALSLASKRAQAAGVPLVCLYVLSPEDFEAHLISPARVDFALRSLAILQRDLATHYDIPLHIETVPRRRDVVPRVLALARDAWGARQLYAAAEYEVDELRRDARLVRAGAARGVAVDVVHDTCVVPPGQLHTGAGRQYAVYTPWWRAWVAHLHAHPDLLAASEPPARNPAGARERFADVFCCQIPEAPPNKRLLEGQYDGDGRKAPQQRLRELWPAGEHAALERLRVFCEEKIADYAMKRNFPAEKGATSSLSVHFAAGTLSTRTAVRAARDRGRLKRLDAGDEGIRTWIGEVAWRDFYKHILVHWPYICMNKPFKPEYSSVSWSYDREHFAAWGAGRTGYPIVDAAMRQLRGQGWVHNRCRMIAASFLAKDLLLDWRMGERHFMEHLIDGDFASNSGGWGFSASVGADPQPYFRVFNPLLQSEKFDPDGHYIREWVPELRAVQAGSAAIHDPYARGAGPAASKAGYPRKIVDHKESRERALKEYKAGIERGKAL